MIEFIKKIGFMGDDGETPTPPLPDPTSSNFTASQMSAGFTGPVKTTNPARIYIRGQQTLWSGFISGNEAKLTFTSEFGDFDGAVQVAIDGGAFTLAPRSGQVFTLFTGLAHAKRFVEWRVDNGLGDVGYMPTTGTVLAITGQPPSLQTLSNKVQVGAYSSTGVYSAATIANATDFVPLLQAPKGQDYGSNVASIKIRGAFTKLAVTVNGARRVGVSKNGGAPIFYTKAEEDGTPSRAIVIPCDGSTSTYNVWDDGNYHGTGGVFAVAGDSALLNVGGQGQMIELGDSNVFGSGPGATSGDVEMMPVAATLGYTGSTSGLSGLTIGAAKAFISNVLAARVVRSGDVGVLAIGGNNAESGIDDTVKADYLFDINLMLTAGFTRVLCRGILPSTDPNSQVLIVAANAAMKSVVDNLADPRVKWVDTSTWTGIATEDGAHSTAAGYYPTMHGYAVRDYPALIA